MSIKIEDITPVEGSVIGTITYLGKSIESKILLTDDAQKKYKEENMQPALKIRRVNEKSNFKVGQTVIINDGRINATVIKVNDMEYFVLPEFEIRAVVG